MASEPKIEKKPPPMPGSLVDRNGNVVKMPVEKREKEEE